MVHEARSSMCWRQQYPLDFSSSLQWISTPKCGKYPVSNHPASSHIYPPCSQNLVQVLTHLKLVTTIQNLLETLRIMMGTGQSQHKLWMHPSHQTQVHGVEDDYAGDYGIQQNAGTSPHRHEANDVMASAPTSSPLKYLYLSCASTIFPMLLGPRIRACSTDHWQRNHYLQ